MQGRGVRVGWLTVEKRENKEMDGNTEFLQMETGEGSGKR
jgi:hypothetical protein